MLGLLAYHAQLYSARPPRVLGPRLPHKLEGSPRYASGIAGRYGSDT